MKRVVYRVEEKKSSIILPPLLLPFPFPLFLRSITRLVANGLGESVSFGIRGSISVCNDKSRRKIENFLNRRRGEEGEGGGQCLIGFRVDRA